MRIILVSTPKRAHKILALLDGLQVTRVRGPRDLLSLPSLWRTRSLVLVDETGRWALLAFAACCASLSPLALRVRGEYFREERDRLAARTGAWRWVQFGLNMVLATACLRVARLVVVNSKYMGDVLCGHCSPERQVIVHNPYTEPGGQAKPLVDPPRGGLQLLTVTNMNLSAKIQPLYTAIERWVPPQAWEELDIQWVICGSGRHEAHLREFVSARNLDHRVHVMGHVDGISAWYGWCDVMAHLTRMDSFPNVVMEAMAWRRPVITNEDSCGTREQVCDGETGCVVEDGAAFMRALQAYGDADLMRRHGEAGWRKLQSEFTVDVQRARLHEALHAHMGVGPGGAGRMYDGVKE